MGSSTRSAALTGKAEKQSIPDRDDPFFRITDAGTLQIAPLLTGADDGMAGTLRLPLCDISPENLEILRQSMHRMGLL